jgi:hypothetical protein
MSFVVIVLGTLVGILVGYIYNQYKAKGGFKSSNSLGSAARNMKDLDKPIRKVLILIAMDGEYLCLTSLLLLTM